MIGKIFTPLFFQGQSSASRCINSEHEKKVSVWNQLGKLLTFTLQWQRGREKVTMVPDSTLQILQENLAGKRSVGRERKPVVWGKARIISKQINK